MNRKYLQIIGYDEKKVKVPISSASDWFTRNYQKPDHCVILCKNNSSVYHITDKGMVDIAYCDAHAERRIMRNMLYGIGERGIWCTVERGKLRPHSMYRELLPKMKLLNKANAKRMERKIETFSLN